MKQLANYASLVASAVLISACASAPNPALEEARSGYQTTKQDPAAARSAPQALRNAKANIERADEAFAEGDANATKHYANLAEGYLEIARTQAEQSRLQAQVEKASERRRELSLRAQRELTINAQRQATDAERSAAQARERAAALERQINDLQAERTDRGIVLTLGDVLFATARAELSAGGFRTVDKLASFLTEHAERRVRIEGHTDSRGTDAFNQGLSERRALSVSSALIARGIDPGRITSVGLGESYPKTTNDTSSGRQQNRRVEIIISDKDGTIGSR